MRYLIAIIAAIAVALVVTIYVSSPIANWVVRQFTFDSPDSVAQLHALVYMAINILGLIVGWILGWAIGGAFGRADPVE